MKAQKIKDILKYHLSNKHSLETVSLMARVSKGSVYNVVNKAGLLHLTAEKAAGMSDDEIERLIVGRRVRKTDLEEPDFEKLLDELTKPSVTIYLLWEEYAQKHPDGMKRSTFYERMGKLGRERSLCPSMHQVPKGGRCLQVDYSGDKAHYTDPDSKKLVEVEIFVASWSASSFVYAEASPSQSQENWIASNVRALRYSGCAPVYLVPDNLKSGVTRACFHDPDINAAYSEMARHYGAAVLPARARKPRDKAGVESNVRFVQNFILGRLRDQRFYSLQELNEAIWKLLEELNDRSMQRYKISRRERFEKLDRPFATALPQEDFQVFDIKKGAMVEDDHHVTFRKHCYSVPWRLTGTRVDVWLTGKIVQVYSNNARVASHLYSEAIGMYTTNDAHRPPDHLFVRKLSPMWVLSKTLEIGPCTHRLIQGMIEADPSHSELAVRKGLGIIELCREYPARRIEKAIIMATDYAKIRLKDIKNVLAQGLDLVDGDPPDEQRPASACSHDNIRGADFYKNIQQQGA